MKTNNIFSEQHDIWATPYKFNSKELDAETGLYYYGARYYTPEIGIWLSVDPLSDKYPSLSPYAYCALNPVIFIDPDGREIWITGDGAGEAFNQLSNQVNNITLSMNSDGKIEYKGKAKTKQERLLVKAMEDKKIKVNIKTICNEKIDDNHTISEGGGSFFGNTVNKENGQAKSVEATQYVNPEITAYWDTKSGDRVTGGLMLHEVAEAYYGGKIALKNGKSSPPAGYEGTSFNQAHKAASKISKGALIRTEIDAHLPGISITSRNILHPSQSRYISGDNMNGSFTRKR
ncbi:MAG: RHS repeat-associated core domain-containing protein [Bacteroidales bacterium]|nr:RHS repeat-associated core domain-containing protein [Bacteroidales bacterium]